MSVHFPAEQQLQMHLQRCAFIIYHGLKAKNFSCSFVRTLNWSFLIVLNAVVLLILSITLRRVITHNTSEIVHVIEIYRILSVVITTFKSIVPTAFVRRIIRERGGALSEEWNSTENSLEYNNTSARMDRLSRHILDPFLCHFRFPQKKEILL